MTIVSSLQNPADVPRPIDRLPVQSDLLGVDVEEILARARERADELALAFSGAVTPTEAWDLFNRGVALIVDIRSAEERKFVGHVPETLHVAWASGTALTRNPRFVRELEAKTGKDRLVLLLCRSGKRSTLAAEAAAKAGFQNIFNVLEGFEGDLDERHQRGAQNGWRYWGLPWAQD